MATQPMDSTFISSYLTIETLYNSDKEVVFVIGWGAISEPENHSVKFELGTDDNIIYSKTFEEFTISPNSFFHFTVPINKIIKYEPLPEKFMAYVYIDDKLSAHQYLAFQQKSIINKNIRNAVILPFYEQETGEPYQFHFSAGAMNAILNTCAHSIYCEVKRIIPNTVPHYVSEEKIGYPISADCFKDLDCISHLKGLFGDGLFISGSIYITRWHARECNLKLYVYNSKTGETLEYRGSWVTSQNWTIGDTIHRLIKEIVYLHGMQADLIKLQSSE